MNPTTLCPQCGSCVLRPWRRGDEDSLVRHANNREVWLRLRDLFPHPYGREDAESWIAFASAPRPQMHLANNAASCRVLEKAGFRRESLMLQSAVKEGRVLHQAMYVRFHPGGARALGLEPSPSSR